MSWVEELQRQIDSFIDPWTKLDDELDGVVGQWVAVKDGHVVAAHTSAGLLRADPASSGARCFRVLPRERRYIATL
jgi:hypothetical protein